MTTPDHTHGKRPRRARDGRGRYLRQADTATRDAEAVRLRADGHTYQAIADQLGYTDRSDARKAIERMVASTVREPADEVRQMELIRLDSLWMQAIQVLHANHVTVSNGKVVTLDDQPVPDDGPVLQAIDRLLKIMERRSKLLGLDAPAKVEVMTLDRVDQAIAELERELGGAEAGEAEEAPPASTPEG